LREGDATVSLDDVLPEAFEKAFFVLIFLEYLRPVASPPHDVVQGSGNI
jgi:hypothetical protein